MAPRPKNPPADRRQEILDGALRCFAQKGYNATTNADIARESGITPAALYYYFNSKEDLFRAAVAERKGQLSPSFASMIGHLMAADPIESITHILTGVADFLTQERTQAVLKIILAEGPRDPRIIRIWEEQMLEGVQALFPHLMRLMQEGHLKPVDPRLLFLAIHGPLMGMVITRDLLKIPMLQDITNEAMVRTVIETTLKGFLASPTPET